jgi:hypothetical protein
MCRHSWTKVRGVYHDPALGQQIVDVAEAQGEPAAFAPNYARDYARGGGDYAEPQYGRPVLSWFNSGLNGQGRPLAGLGRSPAWRF